MKKIQMTESYFKFLFDSSLEIVSEDYPDSIFYYFNKKIEYQYKFNNILENYDKDGYYDDYVFDKDNMDINSIIFEILNDSKEIWINKSIYQKLFESDSYDFYYDSLPGTKFYDKEYMDENFFSEWLKDTPAEGFKITHRQFF